MSILLNLKFYRCSKTHSVSQGAILVVRENIPRFTPQPSVAPGVAPGVLGILGGPPTLELLGFGGRPGQKL